MDKRQFIKHCALAASLLPLASCANVIAAPSTSPTKLLPRPLNPGDTVALVSPSKATDHMIDVQIATEVMQALGLKVKTGQHLTSRRGHLAGTDAERASDINAMFADKDVNAIICLRGGSGAARLLPLLDYALIKANPKILLGYSDITALHNAIHAQTGLVTFHGPNGTGSWNSFNADQFRRLFFARELMQ
ncbi:MAG: LD-carboxypeptidase, partial [Rheinheimera sp.]|nr:LD-carboxypeptidase [Rheinheimera sp.]